MTSTAPGRVRLELPADREYTRVARAAVAVLARREGYDVRRVNALQLDVGEALNDLIERSGTADRLELVLSADSGTVEFTIGLAGQPV